MCALFEKFVIGFYQREQRVYRVNPSGRRVQWADPGWADRFDECWEAAKCKPEFP